MNKENAQDWLDELADDAGSIDVETARGKQVVAFKYPETKDLIAIQEILSVSDEQKEGYDGGVVGFMSDVIGMCCSATVKGLRKREPHEWTRVLNATSPEDMKMSPIAVKALSLCGLETITEGIEAIAIDDGDGGAKVEKVAEAITVVPS